MQQYDLPEKPLARKGVECQSPGAASHGPKLLLIDGKNMCHRVFWSCRDLQYKGMHTGLLFGFIKQLIFLKKKFPGFFQIIAWEGGYDRRKAESLAGVASGIIPSSYKEPREKARAEAEEDPVKRQELEDMHVQMEQLKLDLLPLMRCVQARVQGVEADDLIYSYCRYVHQWNGKAVAVSSDQDFFQLLGIGPEITVFDAMKDETWTAERFQMEFGFHPVLWLDVGALQGEVGTSKDNIFGLDGWGPKTACDYVRQYGGIDEIRKAVSSKPKLSKKEQTLLNSGPRLELARSLKRMDDVPSMPRPRCGVKDPKALYQKLLDFGFMSLLRDVNLMTT